MSDDPDYRLDISGVDDAAGKPGSGEPSRRWLGIQFECCGVYSRVYRNREETAYVGRCPRCLREVTVRIGQGGTDTRFFRAT